MATEPKSTTMAEGRGLLTESEREAIAGERSDSYRYKTRSYFLNRVGEVEKDVEVLEEHAPDLLEELREAVCDDESD
jgi:putative heme iron utilization protein